MPTFEDREKSEEARFAKNEELRFKAEARRNRYLGQWAAGLMGLSGAAADAYAKDVVAADLAHPGHDDVFQKVRDDLAAKKVDMSEHRIRRTMDELFEKAKTEILKEG
ncbi:MAG: DUF1476 domain-containing protein [Alphaproteobacteria bacterium]|nr:DUF1476 domain-containing protein [Alphaproteobacteria bacterium]